MEVDETDENNEPAQSGLALNAFLTLNVDTTNTALGILATLVSNTTMIQATLTPQKILIKISTTNMIQATLTPQKILGKISSNPTTIATITLTQSTTTLTTQSTPTLIHQALTPISILQALILLPLPLLGHLTSKRNNG